MIQDIQIIFGEKTYFCKDCQKSISMKRGLKLHRSRNLGIDGFRLDALTLYQKDIFGIGSESRIASD